MSSPTNPLVERYLGQFRSALEGLSVPEAERQEILGEIESHIAESVAAGAKVHEALARLGSAEDLARGYGLEMMLIPRHGRQGTGLRWFPVIVLQSAAVVSVVLFALIMGAIGIGLTISGVALVVAGVVGPFIPSEWMDPTLRAGLPQAVVVATGGVLLLVGLYSLRLVVVNLRFLVRGLWKSLWSQIS